MQILQRGTVSVDFPVLDICFDRQWGYPMNINCRFAVIAALASSMTVATIAPAAAITDTIFKYSTPKNGVMMMSTMAFSPDGNSTAANPWFNSWTNSSLTGNGCFNAGLFLPNGAKITQIRVIYSKGIFMNLIATEQSSGIGTTLATISKNNANSARTGFNFDLPTPHTVQTGKFQYGVGICVNPGESFNGIRILYTYDTAGE